MENQLIYVFFIKRISPQMTHPLSPSLFVSPYTSSTAIRDTYSLYKIVPFSGSTAAESISSSSSCWKGSPEKIAISLWKKNCFPHVLIFAITFI